jgi:hypothetical protein
VSLSAQQLLNQIVAPWQTSYLNAYVYGITKDPLTHFAVIFSTMINDVEHSGVSNAQLIKEGVAIAGVYKNKSIAEQNLIDVAWELLMESSYEVLQRCIFPN